MSINERGNSSYQIVFFKWLFLAASNHPFLVNSGIVVLMPLSCDQIWGIELWLVISLALPTHLKDYSLVHFSQSLFLTVTFLPWWLRWQRICLHCRRLGFSPWSGRSPGEGKGYHSSILAWRIPWTEKLDGLWSMVHGVTKSWTQLSDFHFTYLLIIMFVFYSHDSASVV